MHHYEITLTTGRNINLAADYFVINAHGDLELYRNGGDEVPENSDNEEETLEYREDRIVVAVNSDLWKTVCEEIDNLSHEIRMAL